jgi:hypothetical protein
MSYAQPGIFLDAVREEFKLYLKSEDALKRMNLGSALKKAIESTEAIVSLRDVMGMAKLEGKLGKMEMTILSNQEVRSLIRNVKNKEGHQVYSSAEVSIEKHKGRDLYAMQAFASAEKLSNISKVVDPVFESLGLESSICAPPFVLTYDKKYSVIFLPIIVELLPRKAFDESISNLENRIKTTKEIRMKTHSGGEVKVDLAMMLVKAKRIVERNDTLAVVRDGTHRAYAVALRDAIGTKCSERVNLTVITNSAASSHSIPVHLDDVTVVSEKPESKEDRYPGFVQREMEYFRSIGVDG